MFTNLERSTKIFKSEWEHHFSFVYETNFASSKEWFVLKNAIVKFFDYGTKKNKQKLNFLLSLKYMTGTASVIAAFWQPH